MERAPDEGVHGGVFVGFDPDDTVLTGLARLLDHLRSSFTDAQLEVPSSPGQLLLWGHVCLLWVLVNYAHRFDPLAQDEARAMASSDLRRWTLGVVRAIERRDRALVEYFLIGTLASAGLAAVVGIGLRAVLAVT